MSINALKQAIERAGGQTELARSIGTTQGHVSQWLRRGKVPADKVLLIEKATGVPRYELRPDVFEAA
jgi:DNA-binding transcriptional regulator YdaS (Cro superfamily)